MNKDSLITLVYEEQWSAEIEIVKKQKRSDNDGARLLEKDEGMGAEAEKRTFAMASRHASTVAMRKEHMVKDRGGMEKGFEVVYLIGLRQRSILKCEVSRLGVEESE